MRPINIDTLNLTINVNSSGSFTLAFVTLYTVTILNFTSATASNTARANLNYIADSFANRAFFWGIIATLATLLKNNTGT